MVSHGYILGSIVVGVNRKWTAAILNLCYNQSCPRSIFIKITFYHSRDPTEQESIKKQRGCQNCKVHIELYKGDRWTTKLHNKYGIEDFTINYIFGDIIFFSSRREENHDFGKVKKLFINSQLHKIPRKIGRSNQKCV